MDKILFFYAKILTQFSAVDCSGEPTFFGFPAWWRGLSPSKDNELESCTVKIDDISEDLWVIAVNIIEILSRLAVYLAIAFIIFGGVKFVMSQGVPDKIASAKSTLLYAVIGLVLSLTATAITVFIAGAL